MARELRDEEKRKYVEGDSSYCPFCESENIEGGSLSVDDGGATQKVYCLDCEACWSDCYKLEDIEVLAPPK